MIGVEWDCLEKIMEKLGFAKRWKSFVMKCVTSVNYAIKVNGCPMGSITPTRGIRQGDPLSPYLFLLCAEGLSSLIKASVANGVLKGISVCKGGPELSHLILQTIVLFSVYLLWRIVMSFKEFWESMREPRANS